ncbi:hypothetical protein DHEL01_v204816 [Diaporthe helianthi]|uniref:Uncharacterized protein n=1 Tax=Diaporthe helianthi TaxID=158607 RepID=A0A2P5I2Q5_DIAHE|nr:hypothetical protein DHEL01_v204816 [Diaporthe helianthi]
MPDIMENEIPLQISIADIHGKDKPQVIEQILFNILSEYLSPNSSLSVREAIHCLDGLMPENRPARLGVEIEHAEDLVHQVFNYIWKMAKQIPYTWHAGQEKLADLILPLSSSMTAQTILTNSGDQVLAWREIAQWDSRSELHRALEPPDKKRHPDQQICDQYANASAFAARFFKRALSRALYLHAPTCRLGRRLALSAIEPAVGGQVPNPELLPCHYIAAAHWAISATTWLWRETRWGQVQYYEVTEATRDSPTFPPTRWLR